MRISIQSYSACQTSDQNTHGSCSVLLIISYNWCISNHPLFCCGSQVWPRPRKRMEKACFCFQTARLSVRVQYIYRYIYYIYIYVYIESSPLYMQNNANLEICEMSLLVKLCTPRLEIWHLAEAWVCGCRVVRDSGVMVNHGEASMNIFPLPERRHIVRFGPRK